MSDVFIDNVISVCERLGIDPFTVIRDTHLQAGMKSVREELLDKAVTEQSKRFIIGGRRYGKTFAFDEKFGELRKKHKEKNMEKKYKALKSFTIRSLMADGGLVCEPAFQDACRLIADSALSSLSCCYLYTPGEEITPGTIEFLDNKFANVNGLRYLRKHGYIEEVKEEKTYKPGDVLLCSGHAWTITRIGDSEHICLLNDQGHLLGAHGGGETTCVSDAKKITKEELSVWPVELGE